MRAGVCRRRPSTARTSARRWRCTRSTGRITSSTTRWSIRASSPRAAWGGARLCRPAWRKAVAASGRPLDPADRAGAEGGRVLRLKGGDPCVFGRGGEEALALARAAIPFRIVPGITAGIGGLAYAGIPVTHREVGSAATFVTGHDSSARCRRLTGKRSRAVRRSSPLYVAEAPRTASPSADRRWPRRRREGPIVSRAATPGQRVLVTLAEAAAAAQGRDRSPTIIAIGDIVSLRAELDWWRDGGRSVWAVRACGPPWRGRIPMPTGGEENACHEDRYCRVESLPTVAGSARPGLCPRSRRRPRRTLSRRAAQCRHRRPRQGRAKRAGMVEYETRPVHSAARPIPHAAVARLFMT